MSDCFDHAWDAMPEYYQGAGNDYYHSREPYTPPVIRCKFCGKRDLYWGEHNGKKRLFREFDDELHTCNEYKQKGHTNE